MKNTPAPSSSRGSPSHARSAEPPAGAAQTPLVRTTEPALPTAPDALQLKAAPPWVHTLVKLMDEAIRVPGTNFRFGWDAIIGLIPGVGDATSALSHVTLLFYAFRARVPAVVIARMLMNVAIDELWGSVPLVGDVFDAGFRANRKNLDLIEQRGGVRRGARFADYLVIGAAIAFAIGMVLLPLLLVGYLSGLLVNGLRH